MQHITDQNVYMKEDAANINDALKRSQDDLYPCDGNEFPIADIADIMQI